MVCTTYWTWGFGSFVRRRAALKLGSSDRAVRLAAARELQGSDNEDALPILERAIGKEADAEIAAILKLAAASLALKSSEPTSGWPPRRRWRKATTHRCASCCPHS